MPQNFITDIRYALRSLRKNPGFTVLAVVVMALGIGANTAVFSVVNSVLLRPLDYRDPDRIVTVANQWKTGGAPQGQVSAPDFHDWHDQTSAFAAIAYYSNTETSLTAGSAAEYGRIASVTPEFFRVFAVDPVIGRPFSADEMRPASAGAAVISYGYWQSHFQGNAGALGRTVRMSDKSLTIVGVMPPGFQFPDQTDLWYPANTLFAETNQRSSHNYLVVGRLKPEVSREQAQAQLVSLAARLEKLYPDSNRNKSVVVTRMIDEQVRDVRTTLYLLLGAVALVLLIACANMANLLLAKATSRTREIAIRTAIGASRARIVRQLITESLLLAALSGAAGLLLALWGSSALVLIAPHNVPRLADAGIDRTVLAFTFSISVIASLLFGLAPAVHASKVDLIDALKRGAARAVVGARAGRTRAALVVAEIALSVILLAGAGLLMKSFVAMNNVALGFRPDNILLMSTSVPATDIESARRGGRFYRDIVSQVAAIPGVTSVSATRTPPGRITSNGAYVVDHVPGQGEFTVASPQAIFTILAPGAFAALGIPLKAGRDFQESDAYDAPFTAIINEELARRAFAGQNPLGHLLYCGFDSPKLMRIVGVVGDTHQAGPAQPARPELFMPYQQHPRAGMSMSVIVRTASDPTAMIETLRRKAHDVSPDVPVKFTTLEARLAENAATPRFRAILLGIFAALAVCLAMAGVYGVMAYVVGQRSGEIGLRMALGATPGSVMRLVLKQGLTLAALGLLLGLLGAAATSQLLTRMLFQVKAADPATYAVVALLLAVVALAACWLPARRATHVDPLTALREE